MYAQFTKKEIQLARVKAIYSTSQVSKTIETIYWHTLAEVETYMSQNHSMCLMGFLIDAPLLQGNVVIV